MKKNLFLMSLMALLIISYSCKKDKKEENTPTPITYPNYSQLKVGNYWVYQQFQIYEDSIAYPRPNIDSCYIDKDTIINGHTYYKFFKPYPSHCQYYYNQYYMYSFIRDSSHYIVNSFGEILFSSQDSLSVLRTFYYIWEGNDTLCQVVLKMADKNLSVNTPAGTYITSNSKETYHMYPNYVSAGNPRYVNTRYAENIGIVIETQPFYLSSPFYIERRLVRYHLN